jgi:uncharacterized protein
MKLELDSADGGNRIDGYDDDGIRINGRSHDRALLMTRTQFFSDFSLPSLAMLGDEVIERIAALKPALLLIGSGAKHCFPPTHVMVSLTQRRIGVEVMTTAAACRSYAVLSGEGRDVAALLLPPGHHEPQ